MLPDEMMKILLLQSNCNPQAFQLPFNRSHVITSLLTPTRQPSQLTLSCLKLHLHHIRDVIAILLNESLSDSIPSKDQPTHLSNTGDVPVVVSQVVLVTVGSLKESHKLISNTS